MLNNFIGRFNDFSDVELLVENRRHPVATTTHRQAGGKAPRRASCHQLHDHYLKWRPNVCQLDAFPHSDSLCSSSGSGATLLVEF